MSYPRSYRSAFTLIELLVVIAIIAVLAVVVVVSLNPVELLRQSRDSNRLADLATIQEAIGLYNTDVGGTLGTASTTYLSIADPSATSTAGDQCQGLNLASLPSSTPYQCSASSSFRGTSGTGWLPVSLKSISAGSPIGSLPVDPVNQTSSGFFYTYSSNGSQYEATALMESQRYKAPLATSPPLTLYPNVDAVGSNLALSNLYSASGLVGYWNFDEGSGSSTLDQSGNGNTGNWSGASGGTNNTHYVGGKVGSWAGTFNGNNNYINVGSLNNLAGNSETISFWANTNSITNFAAYVDSSLNGSASGIRFFVGFDNNLFYVFIGNGTTYQTLFNITNPLPLSTWAHYAVTLNGSNSILYINGSQFSSATATLTLASGNYEIGTGFNGLLM